LHFHLSPPKGGEPLFKHQKAQKKHLTATTATCGEIMRVSWESSGPDLERAMGRRRGGGTEEGNRKNYGNSANPPTWGIG